MNPKVNRYFSDGCGRCALVSTPACKVHQWDQEFIKLRKILLDCGLQEELKWSHPCYMFQNKNIILLGAFKEYCGVMFINGALLKDPYKILVQQTENVQAARQLRFTSVDEVNKMESTIKEYVLEAIENEKTGVKVQLKKTAEFAFPEELQTKFDELPALKAAFERLTPGRQRGYLLHFSAPKQAKTREARIEKYLPKILMGKGLED